MLSLGAGVYLWALSTRPMRLLTGLLAYNLANDIALAFLAMNRVNNMFLFHMYAPLAYGFIALLFSYWNEGRAARYMRLSIPAFIIIYFVLLALGYEDLRRPNKYTLSLLSVSIAVITLYTLYNTLRDHADYPIHQDERYWVSFGTLIYYSGNVLVFSGIPEYITSNLWSINSTLAIVGNILYFRAFLCLRR